MTDFARTREALQLYDNRRVVREKCWMNVLGHAGLIKAEQNDKSDVTRVQLAFYEDTKEFNTRENCALIDPDDPWLRRLVEAQDPMDVAICLHGMWPITKATDKDGT